MSGGAASDPAVGTMSDTWEQLLARMREFSDLAHTVGLLSWDQETNMPLRGGDARARQMATMRVVRHERLVDPKLAELLRRAADEAADPARSAMVRWLKRERDRAAKLPLEFVRRLALAEGRGTNAWRVAREERDFALYRTELEDVIAAKREEADLVGSDGERYDALLDQFEPGMRVKRLEPMLAGLRDELGALLEAIVAAPQLPAAPFEGRLFPDAEQWDFTIRLLADLGYDMTAGRQDRSAHPFTQTIALGDVRVTTRIDERHPLSAVFSTIHEAGHGMYEQGFDPAFEDTPLAEAPSYGLHESQSRLWENIVGRSLPFWQHYAPVMQEVFGEAMAGATAEDIYRASNRVQPSLIRVEADEVTYNLHILIRFELELALMRDELEVSELPAAWNEAYERTLGLTPPNDALGVMQDIHWSGGSFGYFPTYTLGNLYSALLWDAYRASDAGAEEHIRRGEFHNLLGWLRENVHRHGAIDLGEDLIRRVTGSGLDHRPFMRYLWTKYAPLYGLQVPS
ncbi:MAG TPA: carboxypeptidase M32 [Gaiellales bacterium]|nr:carboxypeptidase M32 [Gaiellales bacterium]